MFRVWKYPSTIIKAKIGKANLPTFVIQCWLVIIVAHKWSNSMNTIARTCRPKEVIPIFFFSKFINFFHSSFTRHLLNTAARKQVNPWFPAVPRFTSARVYHGKRTISKKLDTQTMSEGAPGPGLGQGSIGTSFQCCPVLIRTAEVEHQTGGRRIDIGKEKQGSYRSGVRRSHSAGLLAEQFQRLLLDDPHAPIHRFLDRNKAQRFHA